ncbi:hypothetical protein [Polaribacter tangerinus]|uniref:hypothetical protein n=1 Tax=Polaribacter tangerinus TaxID=1920034 RepID=UPI000B4AAC1F|nr:hypothetical protein [Polaribacter tangerinus]
MNYLITLLFLVNAFQPTALISKDCTVLKNNSFTYKIAGKEVLIVFGENNYIEYHQNKKYFIESDIEWVTDCEYNLTIATSTLPNFPFKQGTVINIVVDKVKGKKVYYTATLAGRSWKGKMIRK